MKERQTLADTVESLQPRPRKDDRLSNRMLTVGGLLYQMTGLLVLQKLYTDMLDEKRRMEARLQKQESLYKGQLANRDKTAHEDPATLSNMDSANQVNENMSLLSPLYRSMRLQNVKDKMMFQTEGKTAKGLIQENHDLKQAYESQQTTIGKLQQELQWYCQIQHSPSDQASSSFTDKEIVRKLSESDKLLSIQRTLARELGMQLDQRSREIEVLQERLDFEQYGRRREIAQMNAFLNDFVLSCLQIPEIAKDTKAKQAFDQLLSKSETLSEFGVELAVAVQLTSENSS